MFVWVLLFCFRSGFAWTAEPIDSGQAHDVGRQRERERGRSRECITPAPIYPLCICVCVCEFMHTNWKISDLWFVPAKRSASQSVENKQRNNNNKSSTSHAKAGYRQSTDPRTDPEQGQGQKQRQRADPDPEYPPKHPPLAAAVAVNAQRAGSNKSASN